MAVSAGRCWLALGACAGISRRFDVAGAGWERSRLLTSGGALPAAAAGRDECDRVPGRAGFHICLASGADPSWGPGSLAGPKSGPPPPRVVFRNAARVSGWPGACCFRPVDAVSSLNALSNEAESGHEGDGIQEEFEREGYMPPTEQPAQTFWVAPHTGDVPPPERHYWYALLVGYALPPADQYWIARAPGRQQHDWVDASSVYLPFAEQSPPRQARPQQAVPEQTQQQARPQHAPPQQAPPEHGRKLFDFLVRRLEVTESWVTDAAEERKKFSRMVKKLQSTLDSEMASLKESIEEAYKLEMDWMKNHFMLLQRNDELLRFQGMRNLRGAIKFICSQFLIDKVIIQRSILYSKHMVNMEYYNRLLDVTSS